MLVLYDFFLLLNLWFNFSLIDITISSSKVLFIPKVDPWHLMKIQSTVRGKKEKQSFSSLEVSKALD